MRRLPEWVVCLNSEEMKPRTKREKEVMRLHGKLPPLTEKQRMYAEEHCHEGIGYKHGGLVWCTKCGCEFGNDGHDLGIALGVDDVAVCPMCGEKLKVKLSTKRKIDERYYFTVVTTSGGWQVLRHYCVDKWMRRVSKYIHDCQAPTFEVREAVQEWIDPDGNSVIVARARKPLCGGVGSLDFNTGMEIRKEYNGYSYNPDPYKINPFVVYPWKKVIPILKRNGLKGGWPDLCPGRLMVKLLRDTKAETLMKAGQMVLLEHLIWRNNIIYWNQIKIAMRNRYYVSDATMWFDLLGALEAVGKDLHNAKYVCPKNLKEAHDYWVRKSREKDEKRRAEEKRKDALYWEGKYKEEKQSFFGVVITNGRITIRTIQSVAEMMEEGDKMHHCVGTNGYYKKADSLILSARDEQGERLETIEVGLKTMRVLQCYGKCNSLTERHGEILELMNKNMNVIAKCKNEMT